MQKSTCDCELIVPNCRYDTDTDTDIAISAKPLSMGETYFPYIDPHLT